MCVCLFSCVHTVCVCLSLTISQAPEKNNGFSLKEVKQQQIYIPPSSLFLPRPSLHRLQHITFIGLERSLTVKRLWQKPSRTPLHTSCAECSETWTPPSALMPPHTSPGGADPSLRSFSFPPADVKELMTKQQ